MSITAAEVSAAVLAAVVPLRLSRRRAGASVVSQPVRALTPVLARVKGHTFIYLLPTQPARVAGGTVTAEAVEAVHTGGRVEARGGLTFVHVHRAILSC